jgi:glycosyltransferase involved in cell wall biosynthesis
MPPAEKAELVRIITRLNVGGPSHHVTILATRMGDLNGVLLAGRPDAREGSMEEPARAAGAKLLSVPGLARRVSPLRDLRALFWLYRYLRRTRPAIVATHMAKAGTLGRLAAALAGVPVRIHTFHGHVLEGYFSGLRSAAFRRVEAWLGAITTQFVAISPEIASDLDRMGIGRGKTTIVPLGLELAQFGTGRAGRLRADLNLTGDRRLVGLVGRLVPIKNHRLFLESATLLKSSHPELVFVVIGDGELWDDLHELTAELGLEDVVRFTGWRHDLPDVYADLEVVVCCSHNEGTPVSLIEAGAAGKPVVGTDVGGVRHIVSDGVNGHLVPAGDAAALAGAIEHIISDANAALRMGDAGRRLALERHSSERMVEDLDRLYRSLLDSRRSSHSSR